MSYAEWKSDQNWLNGSQKQLVIFSRNLVLTSRKIIEGSKKACFWPKTPLFLTCGGTPWWVLMIFNKKWPPKKISCPKIEYWLWLSEHKWLRDPYLFSCPLRFFSSENKKCRKKCLESDVVLKILEILLWVPQNWSRKIFTPKNDENMSKRAWNKKISKVKVAYN